MQTINIVRHYKITYTKFQNKIYQDDPTWIAEWFFNNSLTIKGERPYPKISERLLNRRQEIIYGAFERKIVIPFNVTKSESVNIDLENGLLTIKINKTMEISNKFTIRVK